MAITRDMRGMHIGMDIGQVAIRQPVADLSERATTIGGLHRHQSAAEISDIGVARIDHQHMVVPALPTQNVFDRTI